MSFIVINGKQMKLLDTSYPDFFEPKPMSPKNKKNILFAQANGTIHFHILEAEENVMTSVLGKRKFVDAFGDDYGDEERYGQSIGTEFFKTNIGHGVFQKVEEYIKEDAERKSDSLNTEEILEWCNKYLETKRNK